MAYKTAAEAAKEVREALKAKGWNRTKVSVRCSNYAGGSSLHVEILSPEVDEAEVQRIAKGEEHVRYCQASGEVLSGGNRYVSVGHSRECRIEMGRPHVPALEKAIEALKARGEASALEVVAPGVLLGTEGAPGGLVIWGRLWVSGQAGMHVNLTESALVEAGFEVEVGLRKIARAKAEEAARAAEVQRPAELDGFSADLQQIVAEANSGSISGRSECPPGVIQHGTTDVAAAEARLIDELAKGPTPKAEKLAARMEAAADALQKRIDQKRDPAIAHQNLTPRRARIAANMTKDAEHLEGVQRVLRQLAREARAGADVEASVPLRRASYASAAAVEKLAAVRHRGPSAPGWASWLHVRAAYEATREPTDDELRRDLERSLVGFEAPGFFPTPRDLADRLVAALGLKPGDRVLEPSAGKGDLVDALLLAEPQLWEVVAVEPQHKLAEVLVAKYAGRLYEKAEAAARCGFVVVLRDDFLRVQMQPDFDAVAMNPPFERGQDVEHVAQALRFLRPGGKLAAIVTQRAAFGPGRLAAQMQAVLDDACSEWAFDQLPDDSFQGAKAFRQTGARCALLVAERKA